MAEPVPPLPKNGNVQSRARKQAGPPFDKSKPTRPRSLMVAALNDRAYAGLQILEPGSMEFV